jgi:hypothetical protein
MTTSLNAQVHHFVGSSHHHFVAMADALAARNWNAASAIVDRVADLKLTASIANLVNSSREAAASFIERVEAELPPDAIKFTFGGVLSGVGGAALAEAAGLAVALGVTVLSVKVIAIALLLWGLSITLPALWRIAMNKLDLFKGKFADD